VVSEEKGPEDRDDANPSGESDQTSPEKPASKGQTPTTGRASSKRNAGKSRSSRQSGKRGPDLGDLSMARLISIAALLLATLVIGVLFFRVMASFFVPLFLAALLVVIFRPLHQAISNRYVGRPRVSSILTTISILLLVLLPAGTIGFVAIAQGIDFYRGIQGDALHQTLDRLRDRLSLDLPKADQFHQLDLALDAIAEPGAMEPFLERMAEAEQLITQLTESLGSSDQITTAENGGAEIDQQLTPAAALLDELTGLKQLAESWGRARESSDSLARQDARSAYKDQHWRVRNAHQEWLRSLLGNSIWSRLTLLANPSESDLRSLITGAQEYIQPRVLPFTQLAGKVMLQTIIDLGILVIAVYFFFADGPSMISSLMRLSPLDESSVRRLLIQFDHTSRAVVLATVLSALAQAALATLGFWACGLDSLVMLFLATAFMSLIPFLGPTVVWGPVAIYLASVEGRWLAALLLVVYCLTVVSTIDNLVRVYVLQGNSQLHPLLALLSVLGGLQVFGPIGILVGPMVVVFLQTLLEILHHERRGLRGETSEGESAELAPLHSGPSIGHSGGDS